MSVGPRYLVIDGYTREARAELQNGGASLAADLYVQMLEKCSPPGTACDVLFPSDEDAVMPDRAQLERYEGIAWTGCSLSLCDDSPAVREQIEVVRVAFEVGVPSFGSCWAAQIAVVAAGGTVTKNPRGREMGIARKIKLTPEGQSHPLYAGKSHVFDGFTSHDDEVTELPPGAVALAGNAWTRVQSVSVRFDAGEFWGLQYHPEYDLHELARLTYCRIDKLIRLGYFKDRDVALRYVDELEALHADPSRQDIAWHLGIDEDVMDEDVRLIEVRNWVNHLVLTTLNEKS